MLLKKVEKDNVIKAMYDSSNILASIYNKETSDLTLIFNKGSQYKYPNVKSTDYTRFEIAESQGKVFNSHIKAYSFEKLDAIDPVNIIKEVTDLKTAEAKALLKGMSSKLINQMNRICFNSTYNVGAEQGDSILDVKQLQELQAYITVYVTEATK